MKDSSTAMAFIWHHLADSFFGYHNGLGLVTLSVDGQPVHEVSTSAGLLLIPVQVFVQAILGARSQLRMALLRPWGPGILMSASPEPKTNSLALRPTPHRMLSIQLDQPTIATKLEWILAYPSATAAWCSVYRHALDGHFDMDMPKAFATASVIGRPFDGKLLVTRMEVMVMTPAEEPHQFAATTAKRSFVFNETVRARPTHGKAAAPTRDERFACAQRQQGEDTSVAAVLPLTDAQWRALSRW